MIYSNDCYLKEKCNKFIRGDCDSCNHYCVKLFKIDSLYNEALLSNDQKKFKSLKLFNEYDRQPFGELKNICDNVVDFISKGNNIYIYSSTTGNGKTSWAIKILQSYIGQIWYGSDIECRALFINVPKFLMSLKDNISEKNDYVTHIKHNVMNADIVVWDDIGTKMVTEFESENLLSIINSRIDSGKSNIYTANIMPNQLEKVLGARLSSRISGSKQIQFFGRDVRGWEANKD